MGKCRGLGKNGKCSVKNQSEFGTTIGNVENCYYLCVAPSKEYTRLKGIAYYYMQQNNLFISEKPSELMAQNQSALLDAEVFLNDNYDLRRNVLSGKSTFAYRLLPPELRQYYLDHINFGNKFDSEMALTHNLLVNIDEFANMGASQQGKLKQTLSKVKVNGRPIFGRSQEDRPRFASFLATTNDRHPLCDGTGSRRYICISVPVGCNIDNDSPIDYSQLYAQLRQELADGRRYWFNNEEVALIQKANQPYYKVSDVEQILFSCFRLPEEQEEGQWFRGSEITELLSVHYPELRVSHTLQINIGKTLRALGCEVKHTKIGQAYQLVALKALKSIA